MWCCSSPNNVLHIHAQKTNWQTWLAPWSYWVRSSKEPDYRYWANVNTPPILWRTRCLYWSSDCLLPAVPIHYPATGRDAIETIAGEPRGSWIKTWKFDQQGTCSGQKVQEKIILSTKLNGFFILDINHKTRSNKKQSSLIKVFVIV